MTLREYLEYAVTVATLNLSRILPERAVYALFKGFALSFYAASARRRNLSLRNIKIAFPEKSNEERRILVKRSYINLSESMALGLLITTNRVSNERLLSMVETDGWEQFERTQTVGEKGLLAITGHLGNWELMPQYAALRLNRQVHVISRKGNNKLLEERIVRPLRERFGVNIFYKKNALIRIVKAVNKGDICGLLIDQKLNPPQGIHVDFFGKTAPSTGSPALLQIRFGITVQSAFMVKIGHQKFRLHIGEPIHWDDNEKPLEDQVRELTQIHQKIVEDMVRKYPDQWFWAHNRWGLPKVK